MYVHSARHGQLTWSIRAEQHDKKEMWTAMLQRGAENGEMMVRHGSTTRVTGECEHYWGTYTLPVLYIEYV